MDPLNTDLDAAQAANNAAPAKGAKAAVALITQADSGFSLPPGGIAELLASQPPALITPAIAPSAAEVAEAKWSGVFSAWVASHVADSPIARDTAAYNHLIHVALPALRADIMEIF